MSTQTIQQQIPAGAYAVDPVHSSVGFAVVHNGVSTFRSGFGSYEARLSGGESPGLEGTVDVASIEIEEPNLKGHLLSPEFFDAEKTPEISFQSTKIRAEDSQVVVDGELTVSGITKPVVARGELSEPVPGPSGSDHIGLDLETKVDRHDYGLDWQMELPGGGTTLGDEVTLSVHLELIKE